MTDDVAAIVVPIVAIWQKEINSGENSRVLSLNRVCTEYKWVNAGHPCSMRNSNQHATSPIRYKSDRWGICQFQVQRGFRRRVKYPNPPILNSLLQHHTSIRPDPCRCSVHGPFRQQEQWNNGCSRYGPKVARVGVVWSSVAGCNVKAGHLAIPEPPPWQLSRLAG